MKNINAGTLPAGKKTAVKKTAGTKKSPAKGLSVCALYRACSGMISSRMQESSSRS